MPNLRALLGTERQMRWCRTRCRPLKNWGWSFIIWIFSDMLLWRAQLNVLWYLKIAWQIALPGWPRMRSHNIWRWWNLCKAKMRELSPLRPLRCWNGSRFLTKPGCPPPGRRAGGLGCWRDKCGEVAPFLPDGGGGLRVLYLLSMIKNPKTSKSGKTMCFSFPEVF